MDRDCSVLLYDEDEKDDSDLDEIVKRNLLSELDTTLKVEKEYVKVYLRIRPFTKDEQDKNENQRCVEIDDEHSVVVQAPKDSHTHRSTAYGLAKQVQKFKFSKVFGDNTSQKAFFDETMLTTVREFINGENCLVFTYGVTNSGKTYTIQGEPKDGGLLPRSLDVVFNSVNNRLYSRMDLKPNMHSDVLRLTVEQEQAEIALKESILKMTFSDEKDVCAASTSSDSLQAMSEDSLNHPSQGHNGDIDSLVDEISTVVANRKREEATIEVKSQGQIRFSIWVSFVEIYNEQMYDLLVPVSKKKFERRPILQLRDDKYGNPYVKDLRQINVSSADEAYRLLALGKRNLKIACTKLNQSSSRSHCIFTIKMIRVVDRDQPYYARVSVLSLCDLAGSERHQKTENAGDRLKEAGNINSSLLTLGRCITALRTNQSSKHTDRNQVVPFRDSKLTRLFQTYLTGKGRASMIVNINQCASMFDETLNSLRYSAIAKQVVVRESLPKPGIFELSKRQDSFQPTKQKTTLDRGTIGWATPGTYQKMIDAGEMSVLSSTFPATKEEEDDENDETVHEDEEEQCTTTENDTSELEEDETLRAKWTKEREMLLEVIQQLKEKLQSEVNAKDALEMKVRAEVCEEMKKQLVIIENQYQESLRLREEISEDKLEKKMEIYMEAMQKSKKRRLENDDEEYVPKHLLQAEKAKVLKCNNRIEELEDELKALKEEIIKVKSNFSVISKERESLTQEMTKAQFFASDAKQRLDDMQSKLNESTVDLSEQIRSLTEECESQRFTVNQSSELIKDLELKNKSLLDKLEERDALLEQLKIELASQKESLAVAKEQTANEEKEQHTESFHVNAEMEQIKLELEKVKQESNDLITEKDMRIDGLTQEKEQAECLASDFKIQITELKKDLANSKNETLVVVQKLNSAREERDRLAKVNEEANQLVSELRTQTAELKAELASSQDKVLTLEAKVQAILNEKDNFDKTTEEVAGLNSDLKSQITRAEAELSMCRSDLAFTEKQLESVTEERKEANQLVSELRTQTAELKAELASSQDKVLMLETKVQAILNEKDNFDKTTEEVAGLNSDLKSQITRAEAELSMCRSDLAFTEKRLESVTEERDALSLEKQQLTCVMSEQKTQILEVKEKLSCCQDSMTDAEKQLESVAEDRNNLAEEKMQITKLLSEQELLVEELKSKLINYEGQVNELEERCVTLSLEVECLLTKKQELSETDELEKQQQKSLNESGSIAELKAQNEYLEVTLEKIRSDFEKCSKERDHLEVESTRAQFLSSGAKLKLEQMQKRLDEKSELITDLHTKLNDLNSDYEFQKSVTARSAEDVARLEGEVAGLVEQLSRQKRSDSGYPEALKKELQVLEHKLLTSQEIEKELKEKLKSSTQQLHVSEATVAELKSHLKTRNSAVRKLSQTPVVRTSRLNGQLMGVGSDEADDEADVSRMEFENIINRNLQDTSSASRSRTRSTYSKSKLLKPVENLEPLDEPDQEENVDTPRRSNRKTPAAFNKHLSDNFTHDSNMEKIPSMKSPQKSPTIPKRRRKLLSTVDEQLVATPCAQEENEIVEPSPHTSVIRKLRSRKH